MLSEFQHRLYTARKGAALTEYAMLAGLVAVVSIPSIAIYGGQLSSVFTAAGEEIAEARETRPDEAGPTTPSREPWSFPSAAASDGCQIMTNGNDTVLLAADPEFTCYHLLAGVDDFDGSATSEPLTVYTDAAAAGADDRDNILLGDGADFLDGAGASEIFAGDGDDNIRVNIGVTPGNLDFDMGGGDDILHLTTTGYTDESPYKRVDVHLQAGIDEALFTCDHPSKPPYTLRSWDDASVKSSCRTEIFFDEPGFDTRLDVTMENQTWASGTQFLAPGNINAKYDIATGSYIFEFHKDISGSIDINSVGHEGDKSNFDLSFFRHGGPQQNLTMDISGVFDEVNLVLPPELSPNIDLEFGIEVWSTVKFYLGERSVIGDLPEVKLTGSEVRLDFEPWASATDDDLRLALLDASGAVIHDFDMALNAGATPTLTSIDPEADAITKIRLARQGQEEIIPINSTAAALSVHTIDIRHE